MVWQVVCLCEGEINGRFVFISASQGAQQRNMSWSYLCSEACLPTIVNPILSPWREETKVRRLMSLLTNDWKGSWYIKTTKSLELKIAIKGSWFMNTIKSLEGKIAIKDGGCSFWKIENGDVRAWYCVLPLPQWSLDIPTTVSVGGLWFWLKIHVLFFFHSRQAHQRSGTQSLDYDFESTFLHTRQAHKRSVTI